MSSRPFAGQEAAAAESGYLFDVQTSGDGKTWSSITPHDPPHFAREAVTASELAARVLAQCIAGEDADEVCLRVLVWAADADEATDAPLAVAQTRQAVTPA
jgi:hypothetical protein